MTAHLDPHPPSVETPQVLGRGGLAVVERIVDPSTGEFLARKRLRSRHLGETRHEESLRAEAQILARLDHPGIPKVHTTGRLGEGHPFFTMPVIDGEDLEVRIKRGDLDPDDAIRVVESVCAPLAYAHRMQICHGDLKPGNLMLDRRGEAFVIDWGLARDGVPRTSDRGTVSGTANYMSPEQALGGAITPQTDVFNLGAILCRIVTGTPPYVGEWGEVHSRAAAGDLGDAFENLARCGVDRRLKKLIKECLATHPAERPADAAALGVSLRSIRNRREAGIWRKLFLLTFVGSGLCLLASSAP